MKKIWLDDLREMPKNYTHHVKTVEEAIELLKLNDTEEISLDNDLGTEKDGYEVAKFIEEGAFNYLHDLPNALQPIHRLKVHSQNTTAKENIKQALQNAKRYWMQKDEI